MCAKHKKYFTNALVLWKKDIIKANNLGNLLNSSDDNVSSADIVDQASSYTDKSVEMKALNRSRKLISKINSALKRLKDFTNFLSPKLSAKTLVNRGNLSSICFCAYSNLLEIGRLLIMFLIISLTLFFLFNS